MTDHEGSEAATSPEKAKEVLGWEAKKTLKDMVRDSWRWQTTNPNGYED